VGMRPPCFLYGHDAVQIGISGQMWLTRRLPPLRGHIIRTVLDQGRDGPARLGRCDHDLPQTPGSLPHFLDSDRPSR
jgi:hypothetical protein